MSEKLIQQLQAQNPQPAVLPAPATLGFSNAPALNAPVPPSAFQQTEQQLQREDKSTSGDYLGSMWRQDGIVDGMVAHIVGSEMMPDPSYSPFEDKEWKDLTSGVWEQHINQLYKAHSAPHARYIKDLLMRKQEDMMRLGDMGFKGEAARFAFNAVLPDQLLIAMSGGWAARGVKALEIASAGGKAVGDVAAATAKAGVIAEQTAAAASPKGIAAGIATGAIENAGYEKLRQNFNFEDDSSAVIGAALMGAAITTPFALAGGKAERRIAQAAEKEHKGLQVLEAVDKGQALTPEQGRLLDDIVKAHQAVKDVEAGRMSVHEAAALLDDFHGPREPDAHWLNRLGTDLEERGRATLDELFPNRITERNLRNMGENGPELLRLGYDSAAANPKGRGAKEGDQPAGRTTINVDSRGNAAVGTGVHLHEMELQATALKRFPKDEAKREKWLTEQRAEILGLREKADAALKVAKDAKTEAQAAKKAADEANPSTQLTVEEAFTAADEKANASAGETAGLKSVIDQETPPVKQEPPVGTTEVPKVSPEASEPVVPKDRAGEFVTWADLKTGDGMEGRVIGRNSQGHLQVETSDGRIKIVPDEALDDALLGEAPSGFLHGSIGSGQREAIKSVATQTTAKSNVRMDIFATLNRSESEGIRKMVFALVKDPIQVDAHEAQVMTASEWKSHYKRTVGGLFHRDSREAANEARRTMRIPIWGAAQFNHEFHSLVTRLTRGDVTVLHTHKDIAPQLQKASAAQRRAYDFLLAEAKKNNVLGSAEVEANPMYVNRIWNHRGITDAIRVHGADAVVDLLARSINVPGHIGDRAKAKTFLNTVRKLEFSPVMQNLHLYAQDMGTLRDNLKAAGKLSDSEISNLVDIMFTAREASGSDKGHQQNLRYRFDLNETMGINLKSGVLRIADLLENDSRVLVDVYTNSMGGHIGMAKHGMGSQKAFMERMRQIADDALNHPEWNQSKLSSDMKLLEDLYSNITGKPMSTQDFSTTARIAAAFRGYTRSVMLGQLGVAAAFEMKQAVGLMGFRAFVTQVPSFGKFFSAIRKGYIPDVQLARDVEHMAGFGFEMASAYARNAEIDEGFFGQTLTRAEYGANKVSHAVDIMSGNASFTSLTRQLTGMMAAQHLHDLATGLKKLTPAKRERMVGNGVDDAYIDAVLSDLKTYATANKGHKVESIDWEGWLKNDPETYESFQTLLSRQTRDAIQDHDIGETIPFMHSTLGKMFSELKTFFLVAHAKNFLKNAHYMDATAAQVWGIGFLGEALAYMTQTSANYGNDPQKLQEMLQPERIAGAAMFRASSLGVLPMLLETGFNVASGGDSLVQPGATTNTDSRSFLNTPSLIVAKRLLNVPITLGGAALGTDTTTRQEARDAMTSLPGSNLWGVRNAVSYFANTFPVSDPDHKPGR